MKTINKIKPTNKLIVIVCLEILTILGSALLLSRNFPIKLNLIFFLVLLWLIILFSFNQIKGQTKFNKIVKDVGLGLTIIIVILTIFERMFYLSILTIITTILSILKTVSNEQLNRLSSQIGLWIFGLCEIIYSLIGFLSLFIVFRVIIVFVAGYLFKNFLAKRKLKTYISLVLIGVLAIYIFNKPYLYLIIQLLIPMISKIIPKKEPYQITRLFYTLLSFLTI